MSDLREIDLVSKLASVRLKDTYNVLQALLEYRPHSGLTLDQLVSKIVLNGPYDRASEESAVACHKEFINVRYKKKES